MRIDWSSDPDTSWVLSRVNFNEVTTPEWPVIVGPGWPVAASHSRTVWLAPVMAIHFRSGLIASADTGPPAARLSFCTSRGRRQSFTSRKAPDASKSPSTLIANDCTRSR